MPNEGTREKETRDTQRERKGEPPSPDPPSGQLIFKPLSLSAQASRSPPLPCAQTRCLLVVDPKEAMMLWLVFWQFFRLRCRVQQLLPSQLLALLVQLIMIVLQL